MFGILPMISLPQMKKIRSKEVKMLQLVPFKRVLLLHCSLPEIFQLIKLWMLKSEGTHVKHFSLLYHCKGSHSNLKTRIIMIIPVLLFTVERGWAQAC